MAITKGEELQQQISTNISPGINANTEIKSMIYDNQAMNNFINKIGSLGTQISDKYGHEYGKELAEKHIAEQINKGANGDYSHTNLILGLTPVGQEYDKLMDNARNTIIPSYVGQSINNQLQKIQNDENIPVDKKLQILDQSLQNTLIQSNNLNNDTKIIIHQQAMDAHAKMMDFQNKVQSRQKIAAFNDSINKDIENGINSASISLANNNLALALNKIDTYANSGLINPETASSMKSDTKIRVISGIGSKFGFSEVKKFNEATKSLTTEELKQVELKITNDFNQQQRIIETQQAQSGFNFTANFAKAISDNIRMPNIGYTADQRISINNLFTAQQLYKQAAIATTDEQKQSILASGEFNGLDSLSKQMIHSNLAKTARATARGHVDLTAYGIDRDTPFQSRLKLTGGSIKPEDLFFPDEKNALNANFNDPSQLSNTIRGAVSEYGSFAGQLIKKFSANTINFSPAMVDNRIIEDPSFINAVANKSSFNVASNKQFMGDQFQKVLNILEKNGNLQQSYIIQDHLNRINGITGGIDIGTSFARNYTIDGNKLLYKHDELKFNNENYKTLYNNNIQFKKIFKTNDEFVKFMNDKDTSITMNSELSSYSIVNNNRKINIPYDKIDELPAIQSSFFKKIGKSIGEIAGIAVKTSPINVASEKIKQSFEGNNNE